MVRTLGFHPNNEGSNPSSLKINKVITFSKNIKTKYIKTKYTLMFNSLLSVGSTMVLSLRNWNKNKIFVKQSYMILSWIYYISNSKKNYIILPSKIKKLTLLKSPMAHKTYSQEQLKFKYYKILKIFKINTKVVKIPNNIKILNLILNVRGRGNLKGLSTNLIFLKKIKMKINFVEKEYFKLK